MSYKAEIVKLQKIYFQIFLKPFRAYAVKMKYS